MSFTRYAIAGILILVCAPAAVDAAAHHERHRDPIMSQQHKQKQQQQQKQPLCSLLCWARRQLHGQQQRWEGLRDNFGDREIFADWNRTDARRPTQGSAYTNSAGPDEGDEPGDPFTAYSTEPTSVSAPSGVYFHEDGDQALALDPQIGVWGGAWSGQKLRRNGRYKYGPTFKRQNPQRLGNAEDGDADNTTTVSHFTLEAGDQRGMQALSGTYEGARAAAGSNTAFNLATRDSLGGSAYTNDNDAYGPTAGWPNVLNNGDRRSVAFTDLPPNSAAHSGSGYGVVAAAAGWEVASTARSSRTTEYQASLGSRGPGNNGVFEAVSKKDRNRHRKLLQQVPAVPAIELTSAQWWTAVLQQTLR